MATDRRRHASGPAVPNRVRRLPAPGAVRSRVPGYTWWVALLAGAWLAGDRGALLMQSSGSGNCINMLGMIVECRFPLLMLITMRGQWGEFNPWQLPMAQATLPALNAIGAVVQSVDEAGKVEETVSAAAKLAFNTCRPVAVLISQRIGGAKEFK